MSGPSTAMRAACAIGFVLALSGTSAGHGLEPAALSLRETAAGRFEVTWRASALRVPGANVQPVLPARCQQSGAPEALDDGDRIALRWEVDCGPTDLAGESVGIDDLSAARINGLLRIERRAGPVIQAVLSPRQPTFVVPATPTRWDVVRAYVQLGIEHILQGPDHLLFVFGLLLLVGRRRQLLRTVTAFTLGHSITLSLAALDVATPPQRPVEVLIAISVLLLATELVHDERPSLVRRAPWMMAVAFGLLHGFGFAGALAEAGLPHADIPAALLAFNVGIELGQLAFVGVVRALGAGIARYAPALGARSTRPLAYAMGILAAFWCWERLAAWLA